MDEAGIEAAGLTPVIPELKRIDAINSKDSFQREVAQLHNAGVRALFRFGAGQDFKQSTQIIGQLGQGGIGLPDRDYYLKTDDKSKELRDKYLAHVAKMFELAGDDPAAAQARAQTVLSIETKLAVGSTDRALGEALGQVYVQKYFTPAAKARAVQMVQNLINALRDDLTTLSWMSDTTRKRATAKLEAFTRKIGYPDKWRDYATLKVDRKSYVGNAVSATQFEINRQLGKIAKPVDRTEWGMSPPTVNAYDNPSMNEIVFPAGILQPPFYDPEADDAINYGGIGAVIGHEMSHGFDDSGARFDADGNLVNWWSEDDLKSFKSRAQCVIDQFSGFEVQPGLNENGNLVVGESIGDLGGLTIAYAALKKSMEGKPRPADIDGFTPEQRFFLGWAQVWAQKLRPEYERLLVNVDSHPVGR